MKKKTQNCRSKATVPSPDLKVRFTFTFLCRCSNVTLGTAEPHVCFKFKTRMTQGTTRLQNALKLKPFNNAWCCLFSIYHLCIIGLNSKHTPLNNQKAMQVLFEYIDLFE